MDRQRTWLSVKLLALRGRFLVLRLVGVVGLVVASVGGYAIVGPRRSGAVDSVLIQDVPVVVGLTRFDGVLVLVAGMGLVYVATRS